MPTPKGILALYLGLVLPFPGPQESSGPEFTEVSREAAAALDRKISVIRDADEDPGRDPQMRDSLQVSEVELESFVLFEMKDEIPPRVDSIDVVIEPGRISASTELFFDPDSSSGNPIVDLWLAGSHRFFVAGALEGRRGQGRFELQEVRVDGVPVPLFLVHALVERYVNPEYPAVDLDKPFQIPWGIEEIVLSSAGAAIAY